jgi:S1-C subfamily serine protease
MSDQRNQAPARGDTVTLEYVRDGKHGKATVTLGAQP